MSAIVVVICCSLGSSTAKGQCYGNGIPSNELGIRLGSVTNASGVGGASIAERNAYASALNGIHYKRYGTSGAFRAALSFTRFDYENRANCPDCIRTDAKINGLKFRVGYEWFTFVGPLEPFIGIDAIASYDSYDGETWTVGDRPYEETLWDRERRGFGVGPVAGLRVYLGYAISISAETSVEAMMYGRTTTISQITPENTTTIASNNYFDTTFQPLNWLSLNVLF
ncbi:MAG: hypothetical protein AAGN35_08400 [Bacteroidota bacterium]